MSQNGHDARRLEWNSCYNARETGGYMAENGARTRMQALVRTDNLHSLTPDGQMALREYGVRTIIDLRTEQELETRPNPFAVQQNTADSPRYLNFPIPQHDSAEYQALLNAAPTMQDNYIVLLETNKAQIAAVIEVVAQHLEEGAVLVHCHGGKDRTGLIVGLLLSLVGVPPETVIDDYSLSEERLEPLHVAWQEEQNRATGKPVERPRWMESRPETMGGVLSYLEKSYGGAEGYLKAIGVTQESIERIRKGLLEPIDEA